MASMFKLFLSRSKKTKLEKAVEKDKDKSMAQNLTDTVSDLFPHVQPKRWLAFDSIKSDGKMLTRLFYDSLNYFKNGDQGPKVKKNYTSKDDYLRQEKLSPLQLKKQLKRLTIYSIICYVLAAAIYVYMGFIFANVSILDGIICSFFGTFVLAKGLQFSLFVRQVKTGNFKSKLKDLFSS